MHTSEAKKKRLTGVKFALFFLFYFLSMLGHPMTLSVVMIINGAVIKNIAICVLQAY